MEPKRRVTLDRIFQQIYDDSVATQSGSILIKDQRKSGVGIRFVLVAASLWLISVACGISVDLGIFPTATPEPNSTPTHTATSVPTEVPTLAPSNTPLPTNTPRPRPTDTPQPASGNSSSSSASNCQDSSQGRDKVRIENQTGETVTISFYGPEVKHCSVGPGVSRIYLLRGQYSLSYRACGDLYGGEGTINATWFIRLKCQ